MRLSVLRLAALPLMLAPVPALAQQAPAPVPTADAPSAPEPVAPPQVTMPLPAVTLTPSQAKQLRDMLADAPSQGIAHSPADAEADDQGLARAALAYARLVHSGALDEADYLHDWGIRPAFFDPTPAFLAALKADRLDRWIASLPPPYGGYAYLKRGLATYRKIASGGGWGTIPPGGDLGEGANGERVVALRKRLAAEDREVATAPRLFDAALTAAVKRAQRRYGLPPTGVVGAETLATLNVPARTRADQIVANMERWRWLPTELPADRIQVNIAAAVLTYYKQDAPVLSMRAATGRPGDATPILESQITSVVLNPPWNVPASIAKKELWPKGAKYLARNGYRIIATPDGGQRLQQQSGSQSALGRVKFDFVNPYGVYLHDTPARTAFTRYNRSVSHGCVRLEKPIDLAKQVLASNAEWQPERVDETIAGGKTVRAPLAEPVAVYLLYWTAFANKDGAVSFRADPYQWDQVLADKVAGTARPATLTASR